MILLLLYFEFFKIGLFAIGGGLATIPFLYALSAKTGWFTAAEIVHMIAISEVTPGPLGINMATFAGYKTAGLPGALTATAGIVTPAVLAIVAIANILKKFTDNKYLASAFKGMFAAVCALISVSVLKIAEAAFINIELYEATQNPADFLKVKAVAFFMILFIAIRHFKMHPFIYICIAAALGLLVKF